MPTQADFQRVEKHIINPIQRHWNADFDSETIGDFVDDLAKFNENTLKSAMQKLRNEQKRKPTLAHVIEACRMLSDTGNGHRRSGVFDEKTPWKERDENRRKSIEAYIDGFKFGSSLYGEAQREGWTSPLLEYIAAVAKVQAQMIIPASNGISWDHGPIFGYGTVVNDDMRNQFFADQRRQAQTGSIEVSIPTGKIDIWKKHAQHDHRSKIIDSNRQAIAKTAAVDERLEEEFRR